MENSIIQNSSFIFSFTPTATRNIFRAFKKTKYKRKDLYISFSQIGFADVSEPSRYELRIWLGDVIDDSNCIRYRFYIPARTGFGGQAVVSFNDVLRDVNYNGPIFTQLQSVSLGEPPPLMFKVWLSQVLEK